MPNGKYVLNDLEFENKIEGMDDRKLLEWCARLSYDNAIRLGVIESRHRRNVGIMGGIGTFVGAAIVGAIDYFIRR